VIWLNGIYDLARIHGEIFEIWVGLQRQIVLRSLEAWETDTGITFNQVGDLIEVFERILRIFMEHLK
ncbi:10211_t:CDS:2, partial [Ambispora leptoticha]